MGWAHWLVNPWGAMGCPASIGIKAKLFALGNRHEYSLNYNEAIAHIANMTTVWTILAIAASQSWQLFQIRCQKHFPSWRSQGRSPHAIPWQSPTTFKQIIWFSLRNPNEVFFPIGFNLKLMAYSDVDWVKCSNTCHSTTGWWIYLSNALTPHHQKKKNANFMKCKKQDWVSKSSTEVEYRSCNLPILRLFGFKIIFTRLVFHSSMSLFVMLTPPAHLNSSKPYFPWGPNI